MEPMSFNTKMDTALEVTRLETVFPELGDAIEMYISARGYSGQQKDQEYNLRIIQIAEAVINDHMKTPEEEDYVRKTTDRYNKMAQKIIEQATPSPELPKKQKLSMIPEEEESPGQRTLTPEQRQQEQDRIKEEGQKRNERTAFLNERAQEEAARKAGEKDERVQSDVDKANSPSALEKIKNAFQGLR